MDEKSREVLKKIYDAAVKNPDLFVISIDIGLMGDEKRRIVNCLSNNGYITKVGYQGQRRLQCKLTEKGRQYIKSSYKL